MPTQCSDPVLFFVGQGGTTVSPAHEIKERSEAHSGGEHGWRRDEVVGGISSVFCNYITREIAFEPPSYMSPRFKNGST